jgi:hypothetical protein
MENPSDSIQLAVVGSADAEHVARLVWPDYHPVLGDANRSVLLVRPRTAAEVDHHKQLGDRHAGRWVSPSTNERLSV